MNEEDARALITARFASQWAIAHSTYPIFYEGVSEPDLNTQTLPFVLFKVCLPSAEQADLSPTPLKRYEGRVELTLFVPMGKGTKPLFLMSASAISALAIQTISGIRMGATTPIERPSAVGWQSRKLFIKYSFDSIT